MKKSKWLLFSSLFFICGIAFSGIIAIPFFVIYSLFVFLVVLTTVLWSNNKIRILFILLLFLLLGMIRYELSRPEGFDPTGNKKLLFTGIIIEEPVVRGDYQNIIVKNQDIKVLSRVNVYPNYFYGQEVEIECKPSV